MLCLDLHVITCAHVIAQPAQTEPPDETVYVQFEFAPEHLPIPAKIVGWFPDHSEDVAVLKLQRRPPQGCVAPPLYSILGGVSGHDYRSYGYPRGHEHAAVPSNGTVSGAAGPTLITLQKADRGFSLEQGFSGSPVWDQRLAGVIGIVVWRELPRIEFDRLGHVDTGVGYAVPVDELGRLWPPLAAHIRQLGDLRKAGHRRVIVTVVIMCLAMTGIFAGVFFGAPYTGTRNPIGEPSAQTHEIGDDYLPQGEEFLAKVTNQATGRCIARNGIHSHPNNSERLSPPQATNIYQWDCASGDLSHMLVLAPATNGWLIRSSVKINLCLAAYGTPSGNQVFQVCEPSDDRQQWRFQRVRPIDPEVVVIRNRNTGMCLAHLGDPKDIRILQRPCMANLAMEWTIEKQAPVGTEDCRDHGNVRVRNRETGLYVSDGDRPRVGGAGATMSLIAVGRSAHGCTMQIVDPSAGCMGVSTADLFELSYSSAAEVLWMPCTNSQPSQRWVIESFVEQNGQTWKRIRPSHDSGRCLQQSQKTPTGVLLTAQRCDDIWLQQWRLE